MEIGSHLEWLSRDRLAKVNRKKLERISSGKGLIDLSMINPDLAPPRYLMDRLVEATLKSENQRYAVSRGIRKLREGFASKYEAKFSVKLDPETDICATMGTKDALLQALRVLCPPGSKVLVGKPTYPAHLSALRLANLEFEFFDLSRNSTETLRRIEATLERDSFRALLLNFPNNPTGICVDADFYSELVSRCRKRGIFVLNDFVYGEMALDERPACSLLSEQSHFDGLVEVYSLSKAYSVPGWRVGAICGDKNVIFNVCRLKAQVDYGIYLPLQLASAAALSASEDVTGEIVREYRRRAEVLIHALRYCGWELTEPDAGCSVWARLPESCCDSAVDGSVSTGFVLELLEDSGILALPGIMFGEEYDSFVRFALVVNEEGLRSVQEKLIDFHGFTADAKCRASA